MSRDRDDNFDFEDDLFGDNDNDFDDNDDPFGSDNDFDFDDDDLGGTDLDEEFAFDDVGDEDDFFGDEEAAQERSGPSRTFIILAGFMIIIMLIGLGLVVFLALQDDGPSERDLTVTAVVAFNFTQEAFATATIERQTEDAAELQTQAVIDQQATGTAEIEGQTATAEAVIAQTADAQAIIDQQTADAQDAIEQQTADAQDAIEQQTADAQAIIEQQTAEAGGEQPPTEEIPQTPPTASDIGDIALTATALFDQLNTSIAPTVEPGTGGPNDGGGATPVPGQLPQTGLFDGTNTTEGMGVMMLLAFGLIGIMFGARRLRAMNDKA